MAGFTQGNSSLGGGKTVIYGDADILAEAHTVMGGETTAGVYQIRYSVTNPPQGSAGVRECHPVSFFTVPVDLTLNILLAYDYGKFMPRSLLRGDHSPGARGCEDPRYLVSHAPQLAAGWDDFKAAASFHGHCIVTNCGIAPADGVSNVCSCAANWADTE